MKLLTSVILMQFLFILTAAAQLECGIYEMEGKLRNAEQGKNSAQLIINEGSLSQITVDLENYPKNLSWNARAKLQLEFQKKCDFKCRAKFVKLKKYLEPWQKAKIFSLRSANHSKKTCTK